MLLTDYENISGWLITYLINIIQRTIKWDNYLKEVTIYTTPCKSDCMSFFIKHSNSSKLSFSTFTFQANLISTLVHFQFFNTTTFFFLFPLQRFAQISILLFYSAPDKVRSFQKAITTNRKLFQSQLL